MKCGKIVVCALAGVLFLMPALVMEPAHAIDMQRAIHLNKEARRLLQKADCEGALRAAQEMEQCCESRGDCLAVAWLWQGGSYLDLGKLDIARRKLEDAQQELARLRMYEDEAIATYQLGRIFALTGEYGQALEHFNRSERKLHRKGELAMLYSARATVLAETGKVDAAREDLERAKGILTDPNHVAMLKQQEALVDTFTQEYDKARKLYAEVIENFRSRRPQNHVGIALALSSLGLGYESQGDYGTAEKNYREALRIARDAKSRSTQAYVLNNLGSVNWKRGNYDAALKHYEEALQIQESLDQKYLIPNTLNNIGLVYLGKADYQRALDYFADARSRAKRVGARSYLAWALHDLAFLYKDLGKFMESEAKEKEAIRIADEIKNRRLEATAQLRLGNLYEYFGNFDRALVEYNEAAKTQEDIRDRLFLSNTLVSKAEILLRKADTALADEAESRRNIKDAENLLKEARSTKKEIGAPLVELLCKYALFHIEKPRYGWRGNPKNALKKAEQLITEAKSELEPDARNDRMLLAYVEARYALETKPESSPAEFANLKSLAEQAGSLKFSFLANVGTGLATERLGRFDEAEPAYQSAIEYAEKIRQTLTPNEKRTFLHGEEILGIKHVLPYEGLARVRFRKNDKEASLAASERTKARSFSDRMAAVDPRTAANVKPGLSKQLDDVERRIQALSNQRMKCAIGQGDMKIVQSLDGELNVLRKEQKEMLMGIRSANPKFYAAKYGHYLTIDQFGLNDDEWAIAYEVTDQEVITYLMKGKKLVQSWLTEVPRRELTALVRRFRQPLQHEPGRVKEQLLAFKDSITVGKDLWKILVAKPIEHIPEGEPIVISPDDTLGLLPFGLLMPDEGKGWNRKTKRPHPVGVHYLADRNNITYCQSMTALTLAREWQDKSGSPARVLVVVDPIFDRKDTRLRRMAIEKRRRITENIPDSLMSMSEMHFPRLEYTRALGLVLKGLDEQGTDLFDGIAADKSLLLGKRLNDYKWVVLGTHGALSTGTPGLQEPVIVFTLVNQPKDTDGFLRMNEVMGLDMRADVVALTCCQTGLGHYVSGEGSMSMGRAFRYAGAKSVLMSLWSVSQKASVDLATKFFEHLKTGKGRSEALRLARQAIRKEGYEHPFYWGAFVLAGER